MKRGHFILEMAVAIILIMLIGFAITHYVPSLSAPAEPEPIVAEPIEAIEEPIAPIEPINNEQQ